MNVQCAVKTQIGLLVVGINMTTASEAAIWFVRSARMLTIRRLLNDRLVSYRTFHTGARISPTYIRYREKDY